MNPELIANWIKLAVLVVGMAGSGVAYFAKASELDATNLELEQSKEDLNKLKLEVYRSLDHLRLEEIEDELIDLKLKLHKTNSDNLRIEQKETAKRRILRRLDAKGLE